MVVVAAAVVFPPDTYVDGVDDSKKLDAATRARLAVDIRAKASGVAVGIATVAECVESQAVLDELQRLGVDFAQGFFVATPLPIAQLTA